MTTSRKTQPDPDSAPVGTQPAKPSTARAWFRFAVRCVLYYLGFILMLAFFQRSLIYPATRVERLTPSDAGLPLGQVHDITFPSADGLTLHGWHILPKSKIAVNQSQCDEYLNENGPVSLYFPGNGGNRRHRVDEFQLLSNLGCHVFAFDYRGYGENPGSPSEKKFAEDAASAWRYLTEDRKIAPKRILLYGESLGGGVATRLAAEQSEAQTPPRGLILRSTFRSMVDAASYHYPWLPVRMILIDRYPSMDRITRVTCPIIQFHGARDSIVPLSSGRALFDAAPEKSATGIAKTFVELPRADHNDVLLTSELPVRDALHAFLDTISK
jgi:pimeloyl-ACP methyl ester carboxylesterase